MSRYPDREPRQMSRHVEDILFFWSSSRVVPLVLRPSSRKLPNLESSSRTRQYVSPMARITLKCLYVRTQIQKWGLHVPTCSRHVARVTVFPGKCREMSKTPTNRDCRQMSKRLSRHVCLGQPTVLLLCKAVLKPYCVKPYCRGDQQPTNSSNTGASVGGVGVDHRDGWLRDQGIGSGGEC